jgi:hypothetical protein
MTIARRITRRDNAQLLRLTMAALQNDPDAAIHVLDEIGDCPECLRALLWLQTRALVADATARWGSDKFNERLTRQLSTTLDRLVTEGP